MTCTNQNSNTVPGMVFGVDVAKRHLDIAGHGQSPVKRFANDSQGIAELITWLQQFDVGMVATEATGGLELPLLISLYEAGYSIARLNPRWLKDFARAQGRRAKTDALDARLIAQYVHVIHPQAWQPLDEDGWTFKDLAARRRRRRRQRRRGTPEEGNSHSTAKAALPDGPEPSGLFRVRTDDHGGLYLEHAGSVPQLEWDGSKKN